MRRLFCQLVVLLGREGARVVQLQHAQRQPLVHLVQRIVGSRAQVERKGTGRGSQRIAPRWKLRSPAVRHAEERLRKGLHLMRREPETRAACKAEKVQSISCPVHVMRVLHRPIDSQAQVCAGRKRNHLPIGIGRRSLQGKAFVVSPCDVRHLLAIAKAHAAGQQVRLRGGRQGHPQHGNKNNAGLWHPFSYCTVRVTLVVCV